MGIIDRIILSIYTLLLSVLSLGVILLSLRLISLDQVWTSLSLIYGEWEAALIGAVFFLVSVRLLLAGVRSSGNRGAIIQHTDLGDVVVSLGAVENLVEKAARYIKGVRGVKVSVQSASQGLKVFMKVVVSPESNVPTVAAEVQNRVTNAIRNTVGVELADVKILVENISNDFKAKQRVE